MIISHEHKYLFIEIPLTASWSIHLELKEFYGGVEVLHKHATYAEAVRNDLFDGEKYLVFATVRHPLDCAVSGYFKIITNHKGAFTDPKGLKRGLVDFADLKNYEKLAATNLSFEEYLLKKTGRPYSSMIDLSADHLDFTLRFENLQADFSKLLSMLNLEQIRPLPQKNKTKARKREWETYYPPDLYEVAAHRYGPAMQRWGYYFPRPWADVAPTTSDIRTYKILARFRSVYMTRFRYNNGPFSRFVRKLKAQVAK